MLRLSHILTTAALVAVCAAPASAATFEDLHSTAQNDDASNYVLNRDYGSPDAADAARNLPPVQIPVVEARDVPSSGFDWGDAGIGAAGMLALFSIAGGAALLLTVRRRGHGIA